jgi:type II secretory pathway pseudopilin PulG
MKLKLFKPILSDRPQASEQGFSLIETVIALTTLGVCLAYAMPLFLYAKINNSKSEIRTGALIVAQRVFDNVRSKPFSAVPTDGRSRDADPTNQFNDATWRTGTNADGTNPIVSPANMASISAQEQALTTAMGRQYRTKITYCENYSTTEPTVCSTRYRKFKVEVSYNGNTVYDLEATYTDFQ